VPGIIDVKLPMWAEDANNFTCPVELSSVQGAEEEHVDRREGGCGRKKGEELQTSKSIDNSEKYARKEVKSIKTTRLLWHNSIREQLVFRYYHRASRGTNRVSNGHMP
jgi:hypothetical protein